jgi:hypothetical protein
MGLVSTMSVPKIITKVRTNAVLEHYFILKAGCTNLSL